MSTPHKPSSTPATPHTSTPQSPMDLLARLEADGAISQLRQQAGLMRQLGSEDGTPMLDWVDGVARLLADPTRLEDVEREARALLDRGVRHIIWSGMGGSVLTVQVLRALGFCDGALTIYPLDSTDPEALNTLVRRLAEDKGIVSLTAENTADRARPRAPLIGALFADVVMVGVAMGKTSEEPISHLEWFGDLLAAGDLDAAEHMLVMSIPDSYLERYAVTHGLPHLPLQLDGGHGTPGRMSAPATRVFLLPVALDLAAHGAQVGSLRALLRSAWTTYDLDSAMAQPKDHPYVRLAATLAATARNGACGLLFALPPELEALRWWTEQLMEESLGKGGQGVVVFADQVLTTADEAQPPPLPCLRVRVITAAHAGAAVVARGAPAATANGVPAETFTLFQPLLAAQMREERLAGIAAVFLGLQLSMSLYGYLWRIPFAGQPAVEDYKTRARELRTVDAPLRVALEATVVRTEGRLRVLPPPATSARSTGAPATQMVAAALSPRPIYLDLTINGEISEQDTATLEAQLRTLGNDVLGVPVKVRRAPASYHSTEQSEMDGPRGLVSVRVLAESSQPSLLGTYEAQFLRAQAVGTWMAMNQQGRTCFLLLFDGTNDELGLAISRFLAMLTEQVAAPRRDGTE